MPHRSEASFPDEGLSPSAAHIHKSSQILHRALLRHIILLGWHSRCASDRRGASPPCPRASAGLPQKGTHRPSGCTGNRQSLLQGPGVPGAHILWRTVFWRTRTAHRIDSVLRLHSRQARMAASPRTPPAGALHLHRATGPTIPRSRASPAQACIACAPHIGRTSRPLLIPETHPVTFAPLVRCTGLAHALNTSSDDARCAFGSHHGPATYLCACLVSS